ncbi:hypothetical protein CDD82_5854 [Ophiocordyceps australis]|uniref:Cyclase n=1 Tax=Ophiocordyceps australis TaxID=1399860 RepID=A0A2C5YYU0_9HYPO|nr:hypothetical protein CDD82_5854 [Ophiocordyceps australis]
MAVDPSSVPNFDNLPRVQGMPPGCAWGIFDKGGKKDLVGTLNFLTPEIVKAAASEVKTGISVSLNWPLTAISKVKPFKRAKPKHNILYLPETSNVSNKVKSWEDELEFNPQDSSQWDSLVHIHHYPTNMVYNGFSPDKQMLSVESTEENVLPTLDHWHPRGGLVGRGVLIDYKKYAEEKGVPFEPCDGIAITVPDLESCIEYFGITIRPGDILLLRTGTTEALENPATHQPSYSQMSGLESSPEMARWLWDHRFAAVASDTFALEAINTLRADGAVDGMERMILHHYLLSMFGMPIGELFDLKRLSEYANKLKQYTFLLTSVPLNHPGLVGSPANAVAIF